MVGLTLKQLRYVEAAGRTGSISKAADELNISQSSITAAIDGIEASMQFDLFTRVPAKGIHETPAGTQSLRLIRDFLGQYRDFEAELTAVGGATTGTVRIACFATAAASFLPLVMQRFAQASPDVAIGLLEGNMETVVDMLNEGKADVAFTYAEVAQDQHRFEPLAKLPPYALISTSDPLASQDTVSLAELSGRAMVSLDLPRSIGYYSGMFATVGLEVEVAHSTLSTEMIRTLVAAGFGFTILNAKPPNYVEGGRGYRAVPIRDKLPIREFGILIPLRTRPPLAVRSFLDLCRQLSKDGVFEAMAIR